MNTTTELPEARILTRRRWSIAWLLPVCALVGVIWLFYASWQQRGVPIILEFQQGYGLKTGDALRYRGIEIGKVHQVHLSPDLSVVEVEVRLVPSAREIACDGSRFWIVRPQLDLSGVSGLETIVGANYLSVLPGQGTFQKRFVGLEKPPILEMLEAGGIEITLRTPGRGNLRSGAPVTYRQVVIGTLLDIDLAKDASAVEAKAYIKPNYINLIRENTLFWKTTGAKLSAGWLSGLSFQLESIQTLLAGGVTLAIPATAGNSVAAGHIFTLYEEPQPEWLEWTSYLPIHQPYAQTAGERPHPLIATLRWRPRSYLKRWFFKEERQAWVLPVTEGLLGPADVLVIPPKSVESSAYLTIDNMEILLGNQAKESASGLVILPYHHNYAPWPAERQRMVTLPEDTLVVTDFDSAARFITAEHYQVQEGSWLVDATFQADESWHGAPVVAASDGALLGILWVEDTQVKVVLLPQAF